MSQDAIALILAGLTIVAVVVLLIMPPGQKRLRAGVAGVGIVAVLAALLSRLFRKRAKDNASPVAPIPEPQTTSAEDTHDQDIQTIDATQDAIADHPDADPDRVSDLIGLADRERTR